MVYECSIRNLNFLYFPVTKLIFTKNIPKENFDADFIFACSQCQCEIDIYNGDRALSWLMHQQESYHKDLAADYKALETNQASDEESCLREEQKLFKKNQRLWNTLPRNLNDSNNQEEALTEHTKSNSCSEETLNPLNTVDLILKHGLSTPDLNHSLSLDSPLSIDSITSLVEPTMKSKRRRKRNRSKRTNAIKDTLIVQAENMFLSQSMDSISSLAMEGIVQQEESKNNTPNIKNDLLNGKF